MFLYSESVEMEYHRGRSKMTSPGKGGREVNKNGDFHCFIVFTVTGEGGGGVDVVIFAVTSFLNGFIL